METQPGNDMRNLPTGSVTFDGVPFHITNADANGRRGAVAVSKLEGFVEHAEIPVGATAGAVYLVHTVGSAGASGVAAELTLQYADGSTHSRYVQNGKQVCGWWFPGIKGPDAGIAWRGPNPCSNDVGLCWAAIANPHADRTITSISLTASAVKR